MIASQGNRTKMNMLCDEHKTNSALTTETQRAQRKGFQLLFWGTALQFRSIFAH